MKVPNVPFNEAQRLAALREYDVLDTADEPAFDALTQLAAAILDAPIALVSLIDASRQWFKSRHGLDVTETLRDISFCGHVVAEGAPLVVEDAVADARFSDNPLVTGEPRVRFYCGMPLRTKDGFVLGTLCAIDHVPKVPTPKQLKLLALLAGQVVDQLEARRKRHDLALERVAALEEARRFHVLFEALAEGVVVQNRDGAITAANSSAGRILGLTADQLAGRTSTDPRWRSFREDGSPFLGESHPAMVTLRTGKPSLCVVMGIHKPDGDLAWISINSLPLHSDGEGIPEAVVTTFHDITAIKATQAAAERMARQEHLVTTGTLASGIGHEINNPLAFTLANIEFSIEELRSIAGGSPSGRLGEIVHVLCEARNGAERIRQIVRGLRALARQEDEPIPTDVESAIEISVNIAAHEIRHKATVTRELAPTPPVLTGESRLSQVLVNLLVNAAQAFATNDVERNRITVTSAMDEHGRVSIAVADNGPGIAPDMQRRVFDPFFTSKPVGQGTGLGLSICRRIVTDLGGDIQVESAVGIGTTFRVLLPVATRSLGAERRSNIPPTDRGRVLVIDDEVAILGAIRRVLERDHEVIALSDPRGALARFENGERFDVVFCDIMMPMLAGDALYAKVEAIDPILAERFVFITGGATDGKIQDFLAEVPNERIEKPFSMQNLRGIARRFVARSSSAAHRS